MIDQQRVRWAFGVGQRRPLLSHTQRVGSRGGAHGRKGGYVRIVAFDALPADRRPHLGVPVPVGSTVHAVGPVAIDRPVALGAKELRLIGWDRPALVIDVHVAVMTVMAIEAVVVDAVFEHDLAVLPQWPGSCEGGWE